MANEILRKLTIKNCGFSVAVIKEALGENASVELLKIVGISKSAQPGQTPLGDYLKLIGTFKAVNLITGVVFVASSCILPNFVSEGIGAALLDGDNVEFALQLGVKAKPTSVTGYEFTVRPLIEAKANDAMEKLLALSGFNETPAPALEAPKAAKKGAK
jgi:hypothetical protein